VSHGGWTRAYPPDTVPVGGDPAGEPGSDISGDQSPPGRRSLARRLGVLGLAAILAVLLIVFGLVAGVLAPLFFASPKSGNVVVAAPTATDDAPLMPIPTGAPTPAPSPSASRSPSPGPSASVVAGDAARLEDAVVALVNHERVQAGCKPVRADPRLRDAARAHSTDMATHNFFSHTGSDRSSPFDRMRQAGYNQGLSENIARGYASADDVMRGWMRSPGHRRNILNCAARAVGVGVLYRGREPFWTQDFGRA
jgi:uncharacterized protein YkwD